MIDSLLARPAMCVSCVLITAEPPEADCCPVLADCLCGARWSWDPRARMWFPNFL